MNRMNRKERRAREAQMMAEMKRMPPARRDGRPLYYDISAGDKVQCFSCAKNGITVSHGHHQAVMNDPANPPAGEDRGDMFTTCIHHLPDNAVIYDPHTNLCRSKSGDATWEEDKVVEAPAED
jgi:hypothetical protein